MDIILFLLDKALGIIFPFFKRNIVVSPKSKRVKTSNDIQSSYRYFLFIINQKDKPFYNLNLQLYAEAENMPAQIMISPNFEGQEYKPTYPISAGNTQNQPIVDFGFMGVSHADAKHFSYNLRIDHIDPKETKKLEVVISKLKPNRKCRIKHELTFDKNSSPIEVKKENKPGQISVSVQGLNWKIKK